MFFFHIPTEMSASPFLVFSGFFTMQRYEVIIVKISENGKEKRPPLDSGTTVGSTVSQAFTWAVYIPRAFFLLIF